LWQKVESASRLVSKKLGADEQKVVGLLLPNSIDFVISYLAIVHAGHIALPLDLSFKRLELEAIAHQMSPELIITDNVYKSCLSNNPTRLIMVDELFDYNRLTGELLRISPEKQIASLTFTSGTTGVPKAAPYTHANHIWNIKTCSEVWNWTPKDTLLISLPLSHWYGIVMGLSGALYHGNTLYLQDWFDAKKTLKLLASGKISFFTHVSSVYGKLLQMEGDYDLSKLRLCVSGASPLSPVVWQKFKDRFGVEITECYGSSETGRIAGNTMSSRVPGSPGRVLPGVKLKLDSLGNVLVKSPGIFPGYFNNNQATLEGLTDDGYWKTSDIGELDNGQLYLRGRKQEIIKKSGYTISPRDVEWAIYHCPDIDEVHIVGIQDSNQPNDKIVCFIVGNISKNELQAYCRANLPHAWRPDKIVVIKEIPCVRSGKPQLVALKNMAAV